MTSGLIRFSEHTQPQLRSSGLLINHHNLTDGRERLEYISGLVALINSNLKRGHVELAVKLRENSWFGLFTELVVEAGVARAVAIPNLEATLSFDLERFGILLVDGRTRNLASMPHIASGSATPVLCRVFQALSQGIEVDELLSLADAHDIDFSRELIDAWVAEGRLEALDGRALPPRSDAPSMTWLGHAMVMFEGAGKTIFIDPLLRPKVGFHGDELATLFSPTFAEKRLAPNYVQQTRASLPVPDAVFITHQDVDHFDLATLLSFPSTTTIYVSANDPTRPWEPDLSATVRTVLGESYTVVKLRHGDVVQVGPFRVTAFPFKGEFPESLPHNWNCYLVETDQAAVALTADSGIDAPELEFLAQRLSGKATSMLMSFAIIEDERTMVPYWPKPTGSRLWQWHVQVKDIFARRKAPSYGVLFDQLAKLRRDAGLQYFMPYSKGSTPLHRMRDNHMVFGTDVFSMSLAEFEAQEVAARRAGVAVPPLEYGVPFPLGAR